MNEDLAQGPLHSLNLAAINKSSAQSLEYNRVHSDCLLIEQLTVKKVGRGGGADACVETQDEFASCSEHLIRLHRVVGPQPGRIQFQYRKRYTHPPIHILSPVALDPAVQLSMQHSYFCVETLVTPSLPAPSTISGSQSCNCTSE